MALHMRNEPDAPGAEYPDLHHDPHDDVVNETDMHFAQTDAEEDALLGIADTPLLDPADEAAQQERLHHRQPLTANREV
jgi:hypothetical protein